MIKDEKWPVARLIPIASGTGVEAQERRAASALLAVISAVDEFGRTLLKPLGAPAGKIETFIEVPFKSNGKSLRPDGVITVSRGNKWWGALVEVKTGNNSLDPDQMDAYLDLARELEFQAVLSISNQYVTSSSVYPVALDKRKLRRVAVYHWSWVRVLTEAVVQKEHRGVKDPDQAYILGELIRYFSDPRSGIVAFDNMGPHWTKVRDGARQRTLRKTEPEVEAVASRWDELIRYLCLELTKDLGRDVRHVLNKQERVSPTARHQALRESLAGSGRLSAELQIPDTAGPLEVVADLAARQLIVSTRLDAPKEGRSRGRISWLLRQLQKAPANLIVEAHVARSTTSLSASLEMVREDPEVLMPEKTKDIREFVLSYSIDLGLKKGAGRGSFIDSVLSGVQDFYGRVVQNLNPWKAKPPKLRKPAEAEEEFPDLPAPVAEALEDAEQEMREKAEGAPSSGEEGISRHL
jgi:hypothetical protein